MSYQLLSYGGAEGGKAVLWDVSVLNEDQDEPLRGVVALNTSDTVLEFTTIPCV